MFLLKDVLGGLKINDNSQIKRSCHGLHGYQNKEMGEKFF